MTAVETNVREPEAVGAMVRRVAEEHGGRASLRNRPGGGAEALLELPLEKERA